MPTTALKSGVFETTQTTGTGSYTLAGAQSGYRAWVAGDDGKAFHYVCWDTSGFEFGIGVYTHTGRTLSRQTIIANLQGNTNPVNWGSGTKNIGICAPGERMAMLDVVNSWLADQHLGLSNKLSFDGDQNTYLVGAANDQLDLYVNNAWLSRWVAGRYTVRADDAGSAEGPEVRVQRDSSTPAASDDLGVLRFTGRSSTQAEVTYGKISAGIVTATNGSEDGRVSITIPKAGSLIEAVRVRGSEVAISPAGGVHLVVGRGTHDQNTAGVSILADGGGVFVRQGSAGATLLVNRLSTDGNLADFMRDGSVVGGISVASGVVAYNTFCGGHWSEWDGEPPETEEVGTLVESSGVASAAFDHLPKVRVTTTAASPAIYGVIMGRDPDGRLNIAAVGAFRAKVIGPVQAGDLLESSDIPGVARIQASAGIMASTLGKVTVSDPGEGVRLVPAVLYCG
jgi:hypothetical protein